MIDETCFEMRTMRSVWYSSPIGIPLQAILLNSTFNSDDVPPLKTSALSPVPPPWFSIAVIQALHPGITSFRICIKPFHLICVCHGLPKLYKMRSTLSQFPLACLIYRDVVLVEGCIWTVRTPYVTCSSSWTQLVPKTIPIFTERASTTNIWQLETSPVFLY